jgi:hypothetical protein
MTSDVSGEPGEGEPIIGEPFEIGLEEREPWKLEPPRTVPAARRRLAGTDAAAAPKEPKVLPPPRPKVERLRGPLQGEIEKSGPGRRLLRALIAKRPAHTFFALAGGAMAASLVLKTLKRDQDALFVGQWAPTLLLVGLYRKLAEASAADHEDQP